MKSNYGKEEEQIKQIFDQIGQGNKTIESMKQEYT